MNTVGKLAASRLRHNRSQTLLTALTFVLISCLLMGVSTMGLGLFRAQREHTAQSAVNYHALYANLSAGQVQTLSRHLEVEAMTLSEDYASVVYGKMNARLGREQVLLPGVKQTALVEGRRPEAADEIAGPPAFFQRLGYESPAVGDVVDIPHRIHGEGEVVTSAFIITGLFEQVDLSAYDVADTRIVYSAMISQQLADRALAGEERHYRAAVRIAGEDECNFDEMEARLLAVAADIGLGEDFVRINGSYLIWITDPGTEVVAIVGGFCLLIALFAILVIYGIYTVSIITNVQELGKLKALGATKRQMRALLLREGLLTALLGLPFGLLLGYLVARGSMGILYTRLFPVGVQVTVSLFSWRVLLAVVAMVLVTALLSMLRPMRLVAKISPMEAVRYQESGTSGKAVRKGYEFLTLGRLSAANMGRNRRRTAVTIATMAMGGILFLTLGGVLSSMSELDYVRQHLPKGDFAISLRYELDDATYPENNLNIQQLQAPMGRDMIARLLAIPGVTRVETGQKVPAEIHWESYEEGIRHTVSSFTREDVADLEVIRGAVDYDKMVQERSILVSYDNALEWYGLELGQTVSFTLYDGQRRVPFEGKLVASTRIGIGDFALPRELLEQLITEADPANCLYVWAEGGVEGAAYGAVKAALQGIVEEGATLQLMSLDEELRLAKSFMQAMRLALYLLIAVLGVVSLLTLVNTMVTGIVTRRREIGTLQALGMSNRQLGQMLWKEGLVFTGGTLLCALTLGNLLGYLAFLWSKNQGLMGIRFYHYPLAETLVLIAALLLSQLLITRLLSNMTHRESLVQRIQQ